MIMNFLKLVTASLLVISPLSFTEKSNEQLTQESAVVARSEAHWANVNNITFIDTHALFNSGVAKLPVGIPVTVQAVINYSGDIEAIQQSQVLFEAVDPAIAIGYDGVLNYTGKQATFSFTVTLLSAIDTPKLFTVKVSDSLPEDNQHLTPYSQRQTIVQNKDYTGGNVPPAVNEESIDSTPPASSSETSTTSSQEPPAESSTITSTSTEPSKENPSSSTSISSESSSESGSESSSSTNESTEPNNEETNSSSTSISSENSSENGSHSTSSTSESTVPSKNTEDKATPQSKDKKTTPSQKTTTESRPGVKNTSDQSTDSKSKSAVPSAYSTNANQKRASLPQTGEHDQSYLIIFGIILALIAIGLLKRSTK